MTTIASTVHRLLAVGAAAVLIASSAAMAAPPAPKDVRVYDRHSDDGSTIVIEWAKPPEGPADPWWPYRLMRHMMSDRAISPNEVDRAVSLWSGADRVRYVIEVAQSPDDFEADDGEDEKFVTITVTPSSRIVKARNPKYFGFSQANKGYYVFEIVPAKLFPPPQPGLMSVERVEKLAADDMLTADQAERAIRMLSHDVPADQADAEQKWFDGLQLYVRMTELQAAGEVSEKEVQRAHAALSVIDTVAKAEARLAAELADRIRAQAEAEDAAPAKAETKVLGPRDQAIYDLSSPEKAEYAWSTRLAVWVAEHDEDAHEAAQREVNSRTYYFRLAAEDPTVAAGDPTGRSYFLDDAGKAVFAVKAKADLFKRFKLNNLLFSLIFSGVVLAFLQIAKRNPDLFIRKIAGLEAVEEAIGRATEMGKSVYFVHGLGGMGGMATIAAINVLGRVARRAAEYDTRVQVMNIDPIVTAVSQEVVQQAYTEAGRPDAFDLDDVALVAAGQFSYAAAVAGRMAREQPAAIFLMGSFMAESLLLSESGVATGAIQVAGTDAYHQLPFFVTTCDYTLIGEELYAASAYLSREPRLLGSIRGQDVGKAFMMLAILIGVVALTIAAALGKDLSWIRDIFRVF